MSVKRREVEATRRYRLTFSCFTAILCSTSRCWWQAIRYFRSPFTRFGARRSVWASDWRRWLRAFGLPPPSTTITAHRWNTWAAGSSWKEASFCSHFCRCTPHYYTCKYFNRMYSSLPGQLIQNGTRFLNNAGTYDGAITELIFICLMVHHFSKQNNCYQTYERYTDSKLCSCRHKYTECELSTRCRSYQRAAVQLDTHSSRQYFHRYSFSFVQKKKCRVCNNGGGLFSKNTTGILNQRNDFHDCELMKQAASSNTSYFLHWRCLTAFLGFPDDCEFSNVFCVWL